MAASNPGSNPGAKPIERELVITRVFDAPRELVFQAWIDPKHLSQWWGPKGFINPVCEVDARVGGAWRIVMRAPDGAEYPGGGVYLEIVEPERLVFTNVAVDKNGNPILDGLTTVTFAELDAKPRTSRRRIGNARLGRCRSTRIRNGSNENRYIERWNDHRV
jgi:uncharacterized protein YndB with AHSA1/START domain